MTYIPTESGNNCHITLILTISVPYVILKITEQDNTVKNNPSNNMQLGVE